MRIVCPECQAAYDVPDGLIEPGKRVRCARCNAEWAPVPAAREQARESVLRARPLLEPAVAAKRADAPNELPPAPLVPAHGSLRVTSEPARRPVPVPHPPARDRAAWIGWALTVVVLVLLVAAAVAWRGAVMAGWPASARVYSALGLGAPAPATPPAAH